MSHLVGRSLEPELIHELKKRAAERGVSVEAEHREILRDVLLSPSKRSFAKALASIPDVGEDGDFERV